MRVVLDSNVLISAACFPGRICHLTAEFVLKNHILVVSDVLAEEARTAILRPKFDRFAPVFRRSQFLNDVLSQAHSVLVSEVVHGVRDPRDDHILELAISGKADCIVTGDKDLLILADSFAIAILTPSKFVADCIAN